MADPRLLDILEKLHAALMEIAYQLKEANQRSAIGKSKADEPKLN